MLLGLSLTTSVLCVYGLYLQRRDYLATLQEEQDKIKWREYDENVETKKDAKEWFDAYDQWRTKWPEKS